MKRLLLICIALFGLFTTVSAQTKITTNQIDLRGNTTAPTVAPSNWLRMYFDVSSGKWKASENGGAFVNVISGAGGTVTSVSGVNTNGFSWSISNPTTTPAITLTCATCVTSAASLTLNQLIFGAGNQGVAVGDLTGDVTTAGGKQTTLTNIPTVTPAAGSILFTNVVAPGTPAAAKTSLYVDSTSKNLSAKNDAGTVNHGVQTRTATASNWIRSIADDGSTTISQPAFTDISGTATAAQEPTTTVNSVVNDTNVTGSIAAQALTLGWTGTLAKARIIGTAVYNDQANTYSIGAQDFGAATSFKAPTSAGASPTASGNIAYDSTSNTLEYGENAVNRTIVNTARLFNTTSPITGGGDLSADRTIACATCGVTGSPLSQFAATTSAQLAGVLSDETGTGLAVFGTSPNFLTSLTFNTNTILTFPAAAKFQFGAADAAAPVAQTIAVQNVVAGTSNTAGADLTFNGSQGTGTGTGGNILFRTAPAGTTGTAQNAEVTAFLIANSGKVTVSTGVAPNNQLEVRGLRYTGATNYQGIIGAYSTDALGAGVGAGIILGGVFTGSSVTEFAQIIGEKVNATDSNYDGRLTFWTRINGGNMTKALTLNASQNADFIGKVSTYNNVAAAGWGVPAIYAAGRSAAQTGAVASVATYTVGAADGTFEVSANVLVTTSTTHNFTVTCAYTDEGNTARTITFTFSNVGGTLLTAIINTGGAVPYEGIPLHIRCKASTAITIATTGTFTSVTYNVEGIIKQMS